jgi:hypothetical protein
MVVVIVTMTTPVSLSFMSFFAGAKKDNADFARHRLLVKSILRRRRIRGDWRNPQRSPGCMRKVIADSNAGSRRRRHPHLAALPQHMAASLRLTVGLTNLVKRLCLRIDRGGRASIGK